MYRCYQVFTAFEIKWYQIQSISSNPVPVSDKVITNDQKCLWMTAFSCKLLCSHKMYYAAAYDWYKGYTPCDHDLFVHRLHILKFTKVNTWQLCNYVETKMSVRNSTEYLVADIKTWITRQHIFHWSIHAQYKSMLNELVWNICCPKIFVTVVVLADRFESRYAKRSRHL